MEFRIFIQFYLESTMYDEKDTNIPLLRYFPNIVDKTPSCEIYLMNKYKLFYMYKCNKSTSTEFVNCLIDPVPNFCNLKW